MPRPGILEELSSLTNIFNTHINIDTINHLFTISSGSSFIGYGFNPVGGAMRIDDDSTLIQYSPGDWNRSKYIGGIEGLNNYTTNGSRIGATCTVSFVGTGLSINTFSDVNTPKISVSIDDGAATVIDLYSSISHYAYSVQLASGLAFGIHTAVITILKGNVLASMPSILRVNFFETISTTDMSIKLAMNKLPDGSLKSAAITMGSYIDSTTNISQNIDPITQLIKNASLKQISPVYGTLYQDDLNRADGSVGNGSTVIAGTATISGNKLAVLSDSHIVFGSPDWGDREIKHVVTIPSSGNSYIDIKYVDGQNSVSAVISTGGDYIQTYKRVNGVNTDGTQVSFTVNPGTTYYCTARALGNIYSLSITSNPDYVTGVVTSYIYCDDFTTGKVGLASGGITGTLYFDSIVVTGPVPVGITYSLNTYGETITINGNEIILEERYDTSIGFWDSVKIPVTAGVQYIASGMKKISSLVGLGANIRINWYQADGTTYISQNISAYNNIIGDYELISVTATAPTLAAFAAITYRFDGIGKITWKERLFKDTTTSSNVFHTKEARCDLISLRNDNQILVTKGIGESELAYRVEVASGLVSRWFRDKKTCLSWDRAKIVKQGAWTLNSNINNSEGFGLQSNVVDDSIYISFVGTGIDLLHYSNIDRGIIGITVDGGTEFMVNLYQSAATSQVRIPIVRGLSYGHHLVRIRVTGTTSFTNTWALIDAFDVYLPTIPQTPTNCQPLGVVVIADPDYGWIRFEDSEGVAYNGIWADVPNQLFSYNNEKRNDGINTADYLEFSSVCTGIRWGCATGTNRGIAEVLINDVSVGTVDLYQIDPTVFQKIRYENTTLPLQVNKIKIKPTNTKNASALNYYIYHDFFEIKQPFHIIDLRKFIDTAAKQYTDNHANLIGNIHELKATDINVPTYTTSALTYYVDGATGSDANNTGLSSTSPFKTISKAISVIPQIVNHIVIINVTAGTYNEYVDIMGFTGKGTIKVIGGTDLTTAANYRVSCFRIWGNSCYSVYIQGFRENGLVDTFYAVNNLSVTFYYCIDEIATSEGFYLNGGTYFMTKCKSSNHSFGVRPVNCKVCLDQCTGSGNAYGIRGEHGAIICLSDTTTNHTVPVTRPRGTVPIALVTGAILLPLATDSDVTFFVRPDGNDDNAGRVNDASGALRTVQEAINRLPQIINHAIYIYVADGSYPEEVKISGFVGKGYIRIEGDSIVSSSRNISSIDIRKCTLELIISGINLTTLIGSTGIFIYECDWVNINKCKIIANQSYEGVVFSASRGTVQGSEITNRTRGVVSQYGSSVFTNNNTGTNNTIGLFASETGHIGKNGTQCGGPESTTTGGVIS